MVLYAMAATFIYNYRWQILNLKMADHKKAPPAFVLKIHGHSQLYSISNYNLFQYLECCISVAKIVTSLSLL